MNYCLGSIIEAFTAMKNYSFFIDLGKLLVKYFNCGFKTGEMLVTKREGIITCIPKENRKKHVEKQATKNSFKHCI